MADPTGGIDWNTIGIFSGGFLGTAIGALALRMGWKSGSKEVANPTDTVELKSAIVDSSSIKLLAASIEGLGFNLLELKKISSESNEKNQKLVERLIESIENQTEEIRRLGREIRDHASEVGKIK